MILGTAMVADGALNAALERFDSLVPSHAEKFAASIVENLTTHDAHPRCGRSPSSYDAR